MEDGTFVHPPYLMSTYWPCEELRFRVICLPLPGKVVRWLLCARLWAEGAAVTRTAGVPALVEFIAAH